ncbi:hypothetical protein ACLOJK_040649 [Asimina triloba]
MGDGSVDGRKRQGGVVVGGTAGWCACRIMLQMGGMERGRRVDGGSWSGHGRQWVDGRWLVVWPWASICCRPGEMGAAGGSPGSFVWRRLDGCSPDAWSMEGLPWSQMEEASVAGRRARWWAAGDGGLDGWIEMAPDGGSRGGR